MTSNLLDQFDIIDEINLGVLNNSPSSSLYRVLSPLKKERFDDKERIVFYAFEPIPQNIIDHVYDVLLLLDIPLYFTIILTDQRELIIGFDDIRVEIIDRPCTSTDTAKKVIPLFNTDRSMCVYAWGGLHVWPDGTISPCCVSSMKITKSDKSVFNIDSVTDFDEVLASPDMAKLRNNFRNNIKDLSCKTCWDSEDLGVISVRQHSLKKSDNLYGLTDWESEGELMTFTGHITSLCNLKCRICSPTFSSSIATEQSMLVPAPERKKSSQYQLLANNTHRSNRFWEQLKKNAVTILNYDIYGGESLMSIDNLDFLQYLIDNDLSQHSVVQMYTNGTQFPDILYKANSFNKLKISFSIDNLNKKFELERSGAIWETVELNLQKLLEIKQSSSKVEVYVLTTVSIQNVLDLPEIINWATSLNLTGFGLSILNYPGYLSIRSMTNSARSIAIDKLSEYRNGIDDVNIRDYLDGVINVLQNSKACDGQEFCKEMKLLDDIRNQNFAATHPEIAKLMNYTYE